MSKWLGDYPEDTTAIPVFFTTNDGAGGAVAPSSAFETADVKIYKNGSATEKTTTNGLTMTSPFDSIVGLHCLLIDTSNDTGDAGFWTAGAVYMVILMPDETVDGQTVVARIGQFSLGMIHRADLRQVSGTNVERTFQAGGTTSITLAATEPTLDDALVDYLIYTTGGTGAAQTLKVTDYVGSTRVATVEVWQTGAAPATTDGTTTYQVLGPLPAAAGGGGLDAAGVRAALGMAAANMDTQLGTIAAGVAAVLAKYTGITLLRHWLGMLAGKQAADATALTEIRGSGAGSGTYDPATDSLEAVKDGMPSFDAAAVARFNRNAKGVTLGTVGTGSTTTSIVTSSLDPAATAADQFKGKILTFTNDTATAALRGQSTDITANTSGGVLTVTALTTAPASTDSFSIS